MPTARLRDDDVPEVFRLRAGGLSQRDIAARYRVDRGVIGNALLRHSYAHVPVDAGRMALVASSPTSPVTSRARSRMMPIAFS